jgi:hypothetical protein
MSTKFELEILELTKSPQTSTHRVDCRVLHHFYLREITVVDNEVAMSE